MNSFVQNNEISKSSAANQQPANWPLIDCGLPNANSRFSKESFGSVAKSGSVFVREGSPLPTSLQPRAFDNCDWLHAGDVSITERNLHAAGWHYLELMGKEIAVTMFGMHPMEALRKATLRSLERVPDHRNAAEITNVKMTNVGGVFFATITMVPRHIVADPVFEFGEPRTSAGNAAAASSDGLILRNLPRATCAHRSSPQVAPHR
jgi:hypothetical protein